MFHDFWYQKLNLFTYLLIPFSLIFYIIVKIRRFLYQKGIKKTFHFSIPLIVVGNITVGGTGKTPFVMWLAQMLSEEGFCPAIISRGYGVKKIKTPRIVTVDSHVLQVGDEPLLMAQHLECPVIVCADKVAAVDFLLENFYCNVIISDDGLQHYRLGRDVEVAIIDGNHQFGNGYCLPAGPLREPISRLDSVDFIVYNDSKTSLKQDEIFNMYLKPGKLSAVKNSERKIELDILNNHIVHAVTGIGNPERFFNTLKKLKLNIVEHVFPDHHQFKYSDIDFGKDNVVIMTEKDAVKCRDFADHRHWFLPITAKIDMLLVSRIVKLLNEQKTVIS